MKLGHWILDENERVIEVDLMTWAVWFEKNANRIVKQEWIGDTRVSTVFLGLDHNFSTKGPPILWETMCFSNRKDFDQLQRRCAGTKEQAEAMHEDMVKKVREVEEKNAPSRKKIVDSNEDDQTK